MATKRMFSLKVVDSDAFMDMPQSVQLLYFHLAMRADDDGFVGNPKSIMKTIGSGDDDIKILLAKNFVIGFQSGVIVIKHHRINNKWDKYNCKRTQYLDEFNQLNIKENGSYTTDKTQGLPVQSENSLEPVFRIDKNRIEENRIDKNKEKEIELPEWIDKEIWDKWKNYRKGIKKTLTSLTIKQQIKFLEENKSDYVEIINTSIQNGWTGLFPLKSNNKKIEVYKNDGKQSLADKLKSQVKK